MKKIKGIVLLIVVVLVGIYAITLMNDYGQEFEEKELPEITYDVVAKDTEYLFGGVSDSGYYSLTEEPLILGQELNVYMAKDGTFSKIETFKYYPVFQEEYVAGTVTARASADGNVYLEYSTLLVEESSECYLQEKPCCFVVDAKSIWFVDENGAEEVFVGNHIDKQLDLFDETMKDDPKLELEYVSKGEYEYLIEVTE